MTWEDIGEKARARLDASIPPEWRISEDKMPTAEQKDVMDVPFLSGLFTEREILITTSSATHIVSVIATGEWKAQEVARAFCKRAAVAHQLVRSADNTTHETKRPSSDLFLDKLPYCDNVRRCYPASEAARRPLQAHGQDRRTAARLAYLAERQFQHRRQDECHWVLCVGRRADAERQHDRSDPARTRRGGVRQDQRAHCDDDR